MYIALTVHAYFEIQKFKRNVVRLENVMRKKNNSKKGNSQFDGKINDLYYQIKKYETLCYETINERPL